MARRQTCEGQDWISARKQVANFQNWKCCYCGCALDERGGTMEHIVPTKKGGLDQMHNLAASCTTCNQARGTMHHELFRQIAQKHAASTPPTE